MKNPETAVPFGTLMKEVREREGLTQRELAERLSIPQPKISRLEHGAPPPPELERRFRAVFGLEDNPRNASPPPGGTGAALLAAEMWAARQLLERPMDEAEQQALLAVGPEALLIQAALLRETLEVRASMELLAGAQAFRKRRERKDRS